MLLFRLNFFSLLFHQINLFLNNVPLLYKYMNLILILHIILLCFYDLIFLKLIFHCLLNLFLLYFFEVEFLIRFLLLLFLLCIYVLLCILNQRNIFLFQILKYRNLYFLVLVVLSCMNSFFLSFYILFFYTF